MKENINNQIEGIRRVLLGKFPETQFSISTVDDVKSKPEIKIAWVGFPTNFEVFNEVYWMSNVYNLRKGSSFLDLGLEEQKLLAELIEYENEVYPCNIRLFNRIQKDDTNNYVQKAQKVLFRMQGLSIKMFGKKQVTEEIGSMPDYVKLVSRIPEIRHTLLDEGQKEFPINTRYLSYGKAYEKALKVFEDDYPRGILELLNTTMLDRENKEVLAKTQDFFVNSWTDNTTNFFISVINRKLESIRRLTVPDFKAENLYMIPRLIRMADNTEKLEIMLNEVTMEDLENPLVPYENSMENYSDVLKSKIMAKVSSKFSNSVESVPKYLAHNLEKLEIGKQTIGSVSNIPDFKPVMFKKTKLMYSKIGNIDVFLTDDLVIIATNKQIAMEKNSNIVKKKLMVDKLKGTLV